MELVASHSEAKNRALNPRREHLMRASSFVVWFRRVYGQQLDLQRVRPSLRVFCLDGY